MTLNIEKVSNLQVIHFHGMKIINLTYLFEGFLNSLIELTRDHIFKNCRHRSRYLKEKVQFQKIVREPLFKNLLVARISPNFLIWSNRFIGHRSDSYFQVHRCVSI